MVSTDSSDWADWAYSTDSVDLADSADLENSYFNLHLDHLGFKAWVVIILIIIGSLFSFNREVTVKISR